MKVCLKNEIISKLTLTCFRARLYFALLKCCSVLMGCNIVKCCNSTGRVPNNVTMGDPYTDIRHMN